MKTILKQAAVLFIKSHAKLTDGFNHSKKAIAFAATYFTVVPCILFNTATFAQTTYYVKTTGDEAREGQSWANAFKTLQRTLATAGAGHAK